MDCKDEVFFVQRYKDGVSAENLPWGPSPQVQSNKRSEDKDGTMKMKKVRSLLK